MSFSIHRIYVSTCRDTDAPPWVDVTTELSYEQFDRIEQKLADIEVESIDFVKSLPKWKEAQRFMQDARTQQKALAELAKQEKPDASSLKTAKATLKNLSEQVESDPEMGKTVIRLKSRSRLTESRKTLIRAASYVVGSGGDFTACGVDMSGDPLDWVGKLRPRDVTSIKMAAVDFSGLTEEEVLDLQTPRRTSSATPRRLRPGSPDSATPQGDGSDSTATTQTVDSGAPVG